MFKVTAVSADEVSLAGPADADDPGSPWVVHIPLVEGELVSNFIRSTNGPVRLMTSDERKQARQAAAEALRVRVSP